MARVPPQAGLAQPGARRHYAVTTADLPLACPPPGVPLWNSHPRVYLSFDGDGRAVCPYCSAEFTLGP